MSWRRKREWFVVARPTEWVTPKRGTPTTECAHSEQPPIADAPSPVTPTIDAARVHITSSAGAPAIYATDTHFLTSEPYPVETADELDAAQVDVVAGELIYWPEPPPPVVVSVPFTERLTGTARVFGDLVDVLVETASTERLTGTARVFGDLVDVLVETASTERLTGTARVFGSMPLTAVSFDYTEAMGGTARVFGSMTSE